jgi:hypothetical protein
MSIISTMRDYDADQAIRDAASGGSVRLGDGGVERAAHLVRLINLLHDRRRPDSAGRVASECVRNAAYHQTLGTASDDVLTAVWYVAEQVDGCHASRSVEPRPIDVWEGVA